MDGAVVGRVRKLSTLQAVGLRQRSNAISLRAMRHPVVDGLKAS
jgi:hypothetical protein